MLRLFLFQAITSLMLYLLLFIVPWSKEAQKPIPNKAYFTGLLFSTLYFYGTPIWLLLYGIKATFLLFIACIGVTIVLTMTLDAIYSIEDTLVVGLLLQIPVRVIAGGWLAHHHARLRAI